MEQFRNGQPDFSEMYRFKINSSHTGHWQLVEWNFPMHGGVQRKGVILICLKKIQEIINKIPHFES